MKNQALFSSKDKIEKIKMSSAVIFIWRFRVKFQSFQLKMSKVEMVLMRGYNIWKINENYS